MALVTYDPAIDSFEGKAGNFVYYRNRSAKCVRRYVVPRNPRTVRQQQGRMNFAGAVHIWQMLEPYKKAQWNGKASIRRISGYNHFISEHLKEVRRCSFEGIPFPFLPHRRDPLRFPSVPSMPALRNGYEMRDVCAGEHG